jgi:hypothetical protein
MDLHNQFFVFLLLLRLDDELWVDGVKFVHAVKDLSFCFDEFGLVIHP